jgi:hypothetical protein
MLGVGVNVDIPANPLPVESRDYSLVGSVSREVIEDESIRRGDFIGSGRNGAGCGQ